MLALFHCAVSDNAIGILKYLLDQNIDLSETDIGLGFAKGNVGADVSNLLAAHGFDIEPIMTQDPMEWFAMPLRVEIARKTDDVPYFERVLDYERSATGSMETTKERSGALMRR